MVVAFKSFAFACLAFSLGIEAVPWHSPLRSRSPYELFDSHTVPKQWSRVSAAPKDHILKLQIALKQSNFDELERHLYEVSDPSHQRYGQHLSVDEVNELVKPSDEAFKEVHDWLFANHCNASQLSYSPAKDFISIDLPVEHVESLLDTEYSVFQHKNGEYLVRAPKWSLPKHLHDHIDTIQPTNSFFRPRAKRSHLKAVPASKGKIGKKVSTLTPGATTNLSAVCDSEAVTPLCLRTLYGTVDYTPQAAGKNKVGLTDYLGEANNRSDVSIFLNNFRPEAAAAAYQFKVEIIANGDNQQTPNNQTQLDDGKDLEGNLDAETILGIAWPTPLTAYTTGGSPPFVPDLNTPTDTNEPYLVWVNHVLSQPQSSIPQIISTSYGDDEQTVPERYAKRVCNLFAQLGARGVTVLFSSGDGGVGGDAEDCVTNDGKNTTTFLPSFPDGCPFITSVGATKNFQPEVTAFDARNGFASGGGFSNYFSTPAYQDKIVSDYVKSLNGSYSGLFNPKGRAYPDISAQGYHFVVAWDGEMTLLDGTSASCPAASAVLTLVNDALLAEGKSPLGFLNPWLYTRGFEGFTDITSGSAIGCGVSGFPSQSGWDAATGFGTPFFPKVKELALKSANGAYLK